MLNERDPAWSPEASGKAPVDKGLPVAPITVTDPRNAWAFPLVLRRAMAGVCAPLVPFHLRLRARKGLEDAARLGERMGFATVRRPRVPVIWVHAHNAEAAAGANTLVAELAARYVVLVTTSTIPASFLVNRHLPESAVHQYVPVEHPGAVRRFLDHWRPDVALWVDSAPAPILLGEAVRMKIPVALVNARMPEAIYQEWRRKRWRMRPLLRLFSLIVAQSQRHAARFRVLGGNNTHWSGDLRHATPAPVVDVPLAENLRLEIGDRPVWAAVQTHPGEEEAAATAHRTVMSVLPGTLLILAPRLNYRGADLAKQLSGQGFDVVRRSTGNPVTQKTQILICDGPVDAALACHLSPVVFVGGSLVAEGGHNPLEPGHQNCAVLTGPHMEDYLEPMAELRAAGAVQVVTDTVSLARAICRLLKNPQLIEQRARLAALVASQEWSTIDRMMEILQPLLPPQPSRPGIEANTAAVEI